MARRRAALTREEKLQNLIMNHSMIFMGVFEEVLTEVAERMTDVMAKGASAVASALSGGPAGAKTEGLTPQLRAHIEEVFSGIREEISSQWPKDPKSFKRYISSPAFDKGIKIVEGYDLGRPRLTEKLSDEELASYVFLLQSGDKKLNTMFKELAEWQSSLPKPPWAN